MENEGHIPEQAQPVPLEELLERWKAEKDELLDRWEGSKSTYFYCEGIEWCITSLECWLKQQY